MSGRIHPHSEHSPSSYYSHIERRPQRDEGIFPIVHSILEASLAVAFDVSLIHPRNANVNQTLCGLDAISTERFARAYKEKYSLQRRKTVWNQGRGRQKMKATMLKKSRQQRKKGYVAISLGQSLGRTLKKKVPETK